MRWSALRVTAAAMVTGLATWVLLSLGNGSPTSSAALLGVACLAVGVAIVALTKSRFRPLSLYALYTYSHTALFVARPAYSATFQGGADIFSGGLHDTSIVAAAAIAGVGFVAVSMGYGIGSAGSQQEADGVVHPVPRNEWRAALPWIALTILVGFGLYSVYVAQVGGLGALLTISSGRSVELTRALAGSSGYFTSGLLFTLGASTLLFAQGITKHSRKLTILGVVLLIVAMGPQLLSGSRSVFLPILVTALVCITRARPGLLKPAVLAIAALPAFLVVFIVPRILRQEDSSGRGIDLAQTLAPREVLDGFFGGLDTAMLDAFAHQVSAQSSGGLPAAGGSTYLAALGAIVPRAIWPDKPEAVDTLLNQSLFPATASRGIGFSFSVYSEPYLNFGLVGVVLVCGLLGVALARIDKNLYKAMSPISLTIFALAAGAIFPIVRGSISFDIQRFLIPAIPVLIIALFVHLSGARADRSASKLAQPALAKPTLGARSGQSSAHS